MEQLHEGHLLTTMGGGGGRAGGRAGVDGGVSEYRRRLWRWGRLIGSRRSDCAKGVVTGRWAAAWEGIEFGGGGRAGVDGGVESE
jgi:hypothetical protein